MSIRVTREPHRSRQFWLNHVQRWKHSGLSKAAYCEQHKIKAGSFYNWSSKTNVEHSTDPVAQLVGTPQPAPIQFHPVNLTTTDSPSARFVHVERAGTEVALPIDLAAEQIHHWLSAIHQLHV